MTHELKIQPQYFEDIISGTKTFEIRKNDRNYQVGDVLTLREFNNGEYTNRFIRKRVAYIHHGDGNFGIEQGYCVMALRNV